MQRTPNLFLQDDVFVEQIKQLILVHVLHMLAPALQAVLNFRMPTGAFDGAVEATCRVMAAVIRTAGGSHHKRTDDTYINLFTSTGYTRCQ